jgi:NTE family protein
VDGGLTNPIPVDVARQLGAQFVIAVSVLALPDEAFPRKEEPQRLTAQLLARFLDSGTAPRREAVEDPSGDVVGETGDDVGLIEVLSNASGIVQARIAAARLREQPPDCMVVAPSPEIGLFDFYRAAEVVDAGRLAAKEALQEIRRALASAAPLYRKLARWMDSATGRITGSSDPVRTQPDPDGDRRR